MPSIMTRSNGGWSRSARIVCRKTRPVAAAAGMDSEENNGIAASTDSSASVVVIMVCSGIFACYGTVPDIATGVNVFPLDFVDRFVGTRRCCSDGFAKADDA